MLRSHETFCYESVPVLLTPFLQASTPRYQTGAALCYERQSTGGREKEIVLADLDVPKPASPPIWGGGHTTTTTITIIKTSNTIFPGPTISTTW